MPLSPDLRPLTPIEVPGKLELELGEPGTTRYRLEAGVCRTWAEAERVYGTRTAPYEWIGLMNRYACKRTRLVLIGLGAAAAEAFASVIDLGTGLERPARVTRAGSGDEVSLTISPCGPRSLLRIFWPLD